MFNIVLLDDDQTILNGLTQLITTHFKSDEVHVASYPSPEIALTSPDLADAHLIITDITMNKISGLEFIQQLKQENKQFETIIISAHHDFDYAKQSIDLKVASYLTKPVDFTELLEQVTHLKEKHLPSPSPNYPEVITFLINYIEENYQKNITLKTIAKEFHYNPTYLGRIFVKHLEISFNHYLQTVRIEKAKILLATSDLSIDEISYSVGIPHTSYFSVLFKEATNQSPLKFRKTAQQ